MEELLDVQRELQALEAEATGAASHRRAVAKAIKIQQNQAHAQAQAQAQTQRAQEVEDSRGYTVLSAVIHPSHETYRSFVERGLVAAERLLLLPSFLSAAALAEYSLVRGKLLSLMNVNTGAMLGLRSGEWCALGVLIVDGVVRRRGLMLQQQLLYQEGVLLSAEGKEGPNDSKGKGDDKGGGSKEFKSSGSSAQRPDLEEQFRRIAAARRRDVPSNSTGAGAGTGEARLWEIKVDAVAESLLEGALRPGDLAKLKTFWDDLV